MGFRGRTAAVLFLVLAAAVLVYWRRGDINSLDSNPKLVAVTFDHGPGPDGPFFSKAERIRRLLAVLADKKIPQTANFTVASELSDEQTVELLKTFQARGNLIANHSDEHLTLSKIDSVKFKSDLESADKKLAEKFSLTKWFRFPFLDQGDTPLKVEQARSALRDLGYLHGYVTINDYDWLIDDMVIEALSKGEKIDFQALEKLYLEHMDECVEFYERLAREQLRRSHKHILLLHMTDVTVMYLDRLIDQMRKSGWEFIPVSDAYTDPIAQQLPPAVPTPDGQVADLARAAGYKGPIRPKPMRIRPLHDRFVSEVVENH